MVVLVVNMELTFIIFYLALNQFYQTMLEDKGKMALVDKRVVLRNHNFKIFYAPLNEEGSLLKIHE